MRELQDALREYPTSHSDYDDTEERKAYLRPLLPTEPLSVAFLQATMEPLGFAPRVSVAWLLASMGRTEVLPVLASLLEHPDRHTVDSVYELKLASALALCGDPLGLELIERLFWRSVDKPQDPRSTPLSWILADTLKGDLGTPAALALRDRLLGEALRRSDLDPELAADFRELQRERR